MIEEYILQPNGKWLHLVRNHCDCGAKIPVGREKCDKCLIKTVLVNRVKKER